MTRLFGALFLGIAAFYVARGTGLPVWTSWTAGDATDVAILVFFGILLLGAA